MKLTTWDIFLCIWSGCGSKQGESYMGLAYSKDTQGFERIKFTRGYNTLAAPITTLTKKNALY